MSEDNESTESEIKYLAELLLRKSASDDEATNRRLLEAALAKDGDD